MRGHFFIYYRFWQNFNFNLLKETSSLWLTSRFSRQNIYFLLKYVCIILVPYFRFSSVFGLSVLIAIIFQMLSGFFLALNYIPDPSFVIIFREENINEMWFFFWIYKIHVIGVDCIFVLSYIHILKKIWIKNFIKTDVDGWYTGSFAFLIFHLVVFFGITLSTNHLGDVTVTIAANIFWSLFNRLHKTYYIIFLNKHLNVDLLSRFALIHYILAYYYIFLVQLHIMFIHESWDSDSDNSSQLDSVLPKLSWLWDTLKKELSMMWTLYMIICTFFLWISYPDARVVNYNFFEQWSETEVEEINFFIVSPHWYFRAHMGLLTVCAQHYEGLFWLVSFYILLTILPNIYRLYNLEKNYTSNFINVDFIPLSRSYLQQIFYIIFVGSIVYVASALPCGRFYYESVEGFFGNIFLKLSYQYIYIYMIFLMHFSDRLEKSLYSFFLYFFSFSIVIDLIYFFKTQWLEYFFNINSYGKYEKINSGKLF